MDPDENLPGRLARWNWITLGLLLLGSLPFGRFAFSAGIFAGGLVAIAGFLWMRRSLSRLLEKPGAGNRFGYQFGYIVRLAVLAVTLAFLIAVIDIHPLGLIVGLSVVVINLFWMTIQRALK